MSKVAVWMTNYASEVQLPRAIESVIGQTFSDFTLYVFDNHSPGEAPQIIERYAREDTRVVPVVVPAGLAGIPLMDFAWRHITTKGHDYSITLGGHDFWNTPDHLKILVERMDSELAARGPEGVALVYTECLQVDQAGNMIGKYQDIMQYGQLPRAFIPQIVVTTVNSPHLFGLWNEKIRSKLPIRHLCGGWDHLIVMEAALYGIILWEGRVHLVMQAPPPGDGPDKYGRRHFSPENLARGQQDFIDQIEWCVHCVREAVKDLPSEAAQTYCMMLTASMAASYFVLRGTNLMQIPDAYQQFTLNPLVVEAMKGCHHTQRFVDQLIKSAKPVTK